MNNFSAAIDAVHVSATTAGLGRGAWPATAQDIDPPGP